MQLAGDVRVKDTLLAADRGKPAFLSTTGSVSAVAPVIGTSLRVGRITASGAGISHIAIQVGMPVTVP